MAAKVRLEHLLADFLPLRLRLTSIRIGRSRFFASGQQWGRIEYLDRLQQRQLECFDLSRYQLLSSIELTHGTTYFAAGIISDADFTPSPLPADPYPPANSDAQLYPSLASPKTPS